MAKILSDNYYDLDVFSPTAIAKQIAMRVREKRLMLNLSQQALAAKTGVSLGSLKRFENQYEISLHNLLLIAIVLQSTEEFLNLFSAMSYQNIDEVVKQKQTFKRKRGRSNV